MGFFGLFSKGKKMVQCSVCNASIEAGAAREIDGKMYCQTCFNRILEQARRQQNRGSNGGNYGGNGGTYGSNGGTYGSNGGNYGSNGGTYGGNVGNYGSNGGTYSGNGGAFGSNVGSSHSTGGSGAYPPVIRDIKEAFDSADLRSHVDHIGDQWELVAGISGKANSYQLKYICKDGSKDDIALRVFSLVHVPAANRKNTLAALNGFQRKYRFLRFTIDKDDDVKIEYDMHTCGENIGKAAVEMLLRIMKIVDEIYPELMKQVWA